MVYHSESRRLSQQNWRKKNPELTREYARKGYYRNKERLRGKVKTGLAEMRALSKELGNCLKCAQPKPSDKFVTCELCRKRDRGYHLRMKVKKAKTGQ